MSRSETMKRIWAERLADPNWVHPKKGRKDPKASTRMRETWAKRLADPNWMHPRKGTPRSLKTRRKISQSRRISDSIPRGEACHSYKDGKLVERRGERFSPQYKQWRTDIFLRDAFTCQYCGDDSGGNLIAHHIKSFANYPAFRFDMENGVTLCEKCHQQEHSLEMD